MARARNIKPGFFKNEDLAECSAWARLLFAGLWTLSDREGRLEDRPKRIKGELFAFDSIEVEPLLQELQSRGFIERYRVENLGIIQISQFLKHQNPHHREPPSDLPPPQSPGLLPHTTAPKPRAKPPSHDDKAAAMPGLDPPFDDMPTPSNRGEDDLARGSNRAESGALNPESGVLVPTAPPPGRGTRLPRTWQPDPSDAEGPLLRNGRRAVELAKFRDYWAAQPGQKGVKTDWQATWRNWCRRAAEVAQKHRGGDTPAALDMDGVH